MKTWDKIEPAACWSGMGLGTHLLVASRGGWSFLCWEKPEQWHTMEGLPADEPLILPHSDHPSCEVCSMLVAKNAETNLTKDNWPISWKKIL